VTLPLKAAVLFIFIVEAVAKVGWWRSPLEMVPLDMVEV
jgi:hypothetical protein